MKAALEKIKAEMTAEISKHEKCRNRVKTLDEEGVKLCEEIRDTNASINLKHDDMKNKQAKALKTMKKNHIAKVCSLESSLKAMKESHTCCKLIKHNKTLGCANLDKPKACTSHSVGQKPIRNKLGLRCAKLKSSLVSNMFVLVVIMYVLLLISSKNIFSVRWG